MSIPLNAKLKIKLFSVSKCPFRHFRKYSIITHNACLPFTPTDSTGVVIYVSTSGELICLWTVTVPQSC